MEITLNKTELLRFLKGISINGSINDAVVVVDSKKKTLAASCVDEFSIAFVMGSVAVDSVKGESGEYGVRDLPLLQRVVDNLMAQDSITLKLEKENLRVGSNIKLATAAPDEIKTYYKDKEGKLVALLKLYENGGTSIMCGELTTLSNHLSVFSPDLLRLNHSEKAIIIQPSEDDINQFKVEMQACDGGRKKRGDVNVKKQKTDSVDIIISTKHISAIVAHMLAFYSDDAVQIALINEKPLCIKTKDFLWMLSPIS